MLKQPCCRYAKPPETPARKVGIAVLQFFNRASKMDHSQLKFTIGGITIGLSWKGRQREFEIPPAYQPFVDKRKADLCLELQIGFPDCRIGEKVFDSTPVWSLHRNKEGSAIKINQDYPATERLLILPKNGLPAGLYFTGPDGKFLDPFFGPTLELLMITYLARGKGAIIHACGIDDNGTGMLFAGESGAGKSTLANLWNRVSGVDVLSDDRTLVRIIDGELRMYGTPWHGEAKFGSARGIKLEKIFFLRHGQINSAQPLSTAGAVQKLLQCSFPPYWDAAGMEYTVAFFEQLATRLPCCEMTFEPSARVIEFLTHDSDLD